MMKKSHLVFCAAYFLIACGQSSNGSNNEPSGDLSEVTREESTGPADELLYFYTTVTSDGTLSYRCDVFSFDTGETIETTGWEAVLSETDLTQFLVVAETADLSSQEDVSLPEDASPCIGSGNVIFEAVFEGGTNEFNIDSGLVCDELESPTPEEVNDLHVEMTALLDSYADGRPYYQDCGAQEE